MFSETCAVLGQEVRRFNHLSWAGLFATALVFTTATANASLDRGMSYDMPSFGAAPTPTPASAPVAAAQPLAAPSAADRAPAPALISFGEPVPGHDINSPFGLRRLPWESHGRLHEGIDVAAPLGARVVATADGVVTSAGFSPSYGNFVEVRHAGGLRSFYAHLQRRARGLRAGMAVKKGADIGRVGNTGASAGAHLHFELRDTRRRPLNPVRFIGHSFAEAADLPIKAAARVSSKVRIAYVSRAAWPHRAAKVRAPDASPLKTASAGKGRVTVRIDAGAGSAPAVAAAPAASKAGGEAAQPYTVIAKDAAA